MLNIIKLLKKEDGITVIEGAIISFFLALGAMINVGLLVFVFNLVAIALGEGP